MKKFLATEQLEGHILPLYFCRQNKFSNYYAAKKFRAKAYFAAIFHLTAEQHQQLLCREKISRQNKHVHYFILANHHVHITDWLVQLGPLKL